MANRIVGDEFNNKLYGTWDDDFIDGKDGNDLLYGQDGKDVLLGGAGDDHLRGDWHADKLDGGAGMDLLEGGNDNDELAGGAGDDTLHGDDGNDTLDGGAGNDLLRGGAGHDSYLFQRGAGQDMVGLNWEPISPANADRLVFGAGIVPGDLSFQREYEDLVVGITGTEDRIRLSNFFDPPVMGPDGLSYRCEVQQMVFSDGLQWNREAILVNMQLSRAPMLTFGPGDDTVLYLMNVDGGEGNDTLHSEMFGHLLIGGAGNDMLSGNGDGHYFGGSGDDTLVAAYGTNILDGGTGNDTLKGGQGQTSYLFRSGWGQDSLQPNQYGLSINAIQFGDLLPGALAFSRPNAGTDLLITHKGSSDSLTVTGYFAPNGGEPLPNVYFTFANGVTWSANQVMTAIFGPQGVNFVGTPGNDALYGGGDSDMLSGADGNDVLDGSGGDDLLLGGGGDDELRGGDGDDVLDAGAGINSISPGRGINLIYFGADAGVTRLLAFEAESSNTIIMAPGLRPADIKVQKMEPSSSIEVAVMANGAQLQLEISGPTLSASLLTLQFDDGTVWDADRLLLAAMNLGEGDDYFHGFEGHDDVINGNGGSDMLWGHGGNDTLRGGSGDDYLYGGSGDDTYDPGSGRNMIEMGDGNNTILFGREPGHTEIAHSYPVVGNNTVLVDASLTPSDVAVAFAWGKLEVRVASTGASLTIPHHELYDGVAVDARLEFADGTVWDTKALLDAAMKLGDGADSFDGFERRDDTIYGNGGADMLTGRNGNDILHGGADNDALYGNGGNDQLFGNEGDDRLIDDEGDNTLDGGAGNDMLYGSVGNDILTGGSGDDHLYGGNGSGSDVYLFQTGDGHDSIDRSWDNSLINNNVIRFGAGVLPADVTVRIDGSMGAERLVLSYSAGADSITVDGFHPQFSNPADSSYRITRVEFADGTVWTPATIVALSRAGTQGDDLIVGDSGDNTLDGRGGKDRLEGRDGKDTLFGGDGDDLLLGEAGNDVLVGGSGSDQLVGGDGVDTYVFEQGSGSDFIDDQLEVNSPASSIIRFGAGIAVADVQAKYLEGSSDLVLYYGVSDKVLVRGAFATGPQLISSVEFADGTVKQLKDLLGNAAPTVLTPGANTTVAEGAPLAAAAPVFADSDAGDGLTLAFTREDGSALPAWMSYNASTGKIEGTPGFSDAGLYTVKATATDKGGLSVTSTFAINVTDTNRAPVVSKPLPDTSGVSDEMWGLSIGTTPVFTDPDGGAITLSATLPGGAPLPSWIVFNPDGRGSFSFFPTSAQVGTHEIVLTGTDAGGLAASDTFHVTIDQNLAPTVVTAAPNQNFAENTNFTIRMSTFSDPNQFDALSVTVTRADGSALPSWMSYNPANNYLSGTADYESAGSYALKVTATDLGGLSVSTTFDIVVSKVNRWPVLQNALTAQVADEGVLFSYTVPANAFADPDGDVCNYSAFPLPSWLTLNAATGLISGTPTATDLGTNSVGVYFNDPSGLWAKSTLQITVMQAPAKTLNGTAGNDVLTGLSNTDTLNGYAGNDTLDGGAGADIMAGGLGNDSYFVDHGGDVVTEAAGEGTDTVNSSISYTLGANAEYLTLTGTASVNGTGNELNNTIRGNAGDNVLDGAGGTDNLIGGAGNDSYIIATSSSVLTELAGGGNDTVFSSVSKTLNANIEVLQLTGTLAVNGYGNSGNNLVKGNAQANALGGYAGNDILQGGEGSDTLTESGGTANVLDGGAGSDRLNGYSGKEMFIGGSGNDIISTGSGADIVVFNKGDGVDTVNSSTGADNVISLGHGIVYADLALQKSGNDLILRIGSSDQIILKSWYWSASNQNVATLQVVTAGGSDYYGPGASIINDHGVETFNFIALAAQYDQVRAGGQATWQIGAQALGAASNGGSDAAAYGGELAYHYAIDGNLAQVGWTKAQAVIDDAAFGSGAQALLIGHSLVDGLTPLY
jgi:Ca2+-binding RTX toxin-like protein